MSKTNSHMYMGISRRELLTWRGSWYSWVKLSVGKCACTSSVNDNESSNGKLILCQRSLPLADHPSSGFRSPGTLSLAGLQNITQSCRFVAGTDVGVVKLWSGFTLQWACATEEGISPVLHTCQLIWQNYGINSDFVNLAWIIQKLKNMCITRNFGKIFVQNKL